MSRLFIKEAFIKRFLENKYFNIFGKIHKLQMENEKQLISAQEINKRFCTTRKSEINLNENK